MSIRILVTGGTIDKSYDLEDGTLQMTDTHVREMLNQARSKVEMEIEVIAMKVSTKLTAQEVSLIIQRCQNSPEDKIIITHGTDTMVNTAKNVANTEIGKTIIFVGAAIPYIIEKSDALFNLGCAITAAQLKKHGVYVAMNGQIFPWDKVLKDKPSGVFSQNDRLN